MRRRFLIRPLVLVADDAGWGLAAAFGNTSSPRQTNIAARSPACQAGVATHETRIESQTAPELPSATEIPAQGGIEIPAPTRASFMATWDSASDAIGYLLDVSTDNSFSSYVKGYHDVDVGNVTGRVVIGLNPGTTYYYRVRAYNATGPGRYSDAMSVTTAATAGLIIHATFDNDILANSSLPGNALSANIKPKGANGRAVGLDTPPAMFANGTVGNGGPYDGIVTLNSSFPFQFTRPVSANNFDAQNGTEHE